LILFGVVSPSNSGCSAEELTSSRYRTCCCHLLLSGVLPNVSDGSWLRSTSRHISSTSICNCSTNRPDENWQYCRY